VSTLLVGVVIVVVAVVVAIVAFSGVERVWEHTSRQRHNDVAGFIYPMIGIVYGVLVAQVSVDVWQQFATARVTSEQEANAVVDIYFLAEQFPESGSQQVRQLAREYAESVVREEWPVLAHGQGHPHTTALAEELAHAIRGLDPRTPREQVLYDKALSNYQTLEDTRRLRLYQSREGIHPSLWVVLIAGGVITISFAYLFGLENSRAHKLMIGALTATIVGMLLMIHATDLPFDGDVQVEPSAFEQALSSFDLP
jgi:Protein of unknown function (DUF4239)